MWRQTFPRRPWVDFLPGWSKPSEAGAMRRKFQAMLRQTLEYHSSTLCPHRWFCEPVSSWQQLAPQGFAAKEWTSLPSWYWITQTGGWKSWHFQLVFFSCSTDSVLFPQRFVNLHFKMVWMNYRGSAKSWIHTANYETATHKQPGLLNKNVGATVINTSTENLNRIFAMNFSLGYWLDQQIHLLPKASNWYQVYFHILVLMKLLNHNNNPDICGFSVSHSIALVLNILCRFSDVFSSMRPHIPPDNCYFTFS